MKWLTLCLAVLRAVLLLGGASGNGTAAASVLLDQSHVLTRYMSGASVGGTLEQQVAQTVRVGATGQLVQLDFWVHRHSLSLGTGDLIFDIRLTSADGSPIEDDLSVLANVVIPRGDIVLARPDFPPEIEPALFCLDLAPFGLFFEAGDLFAFVFSNISTDSTTSGIGILGDYASGAGPYPSGQAFIANQGGEFFLWEGTGIQVDLGFRTFVSPIPEPSSLIVWFLIGLSFAGAGWRRRNA